MLVDKYRKKVDGVNTTGFGLAPGEVLATSFLHPANFDVGFAKGPNAIRTQTSDILF